MRSTPSRDGLPGAAGRLDRHGLEVVALDEPVFLLHAADLEHLAAEPDHQRAAEIGMRRVAPLGAPQHVEALAIGRHAAAGAVHERHDAVDVRIVVEHAGALDLARDEARRPRPSSSPRSGCRCSCACRSCRSAARSPRRSRAAPAAAPRRSARPRRSDSRARSRAGRHCARAPSRRARSACVAKPMIWPNLRTGSPSRDRRDRHLVPAHHARARRDAGGRRAFGDRIDRDHDIVVRRQADGARGAHGPSPLSVSGRARQGARSRGSRSG